MTFNQIGIPGPYLNGASSVRDGERGPSHDNGNDASRELPDDSMDRIRELILGDLRRTWDARLQTLETRLQTLEGKVDALRHETQATREQQVAALAAGIDELGQHVRKLGRP